MYVLKHKFFAQFVPVLLKDSKRGLKVMHGAQTSAEPLPSVEMILEPVMGSFSPGDTMSPECMSDDFPQIKIGGAQNCNGLRPGIPSNQLVVQKSKFGQPDFVRWTDFVKICLATKINTKVKDTDAVPVAGIANLVPIYCQVGYREAWGDSPAGNYLLAWSTKPDQFEAEARAQASGLDDSIAKMAAGKGPVELDLDAAAPAETIKRRVASFPAKDASGKPDDTAAKGKDAAAKGKDAAAKGKDAAAKGKA